MEQYEILERAILNCLIINPKNFDKLKIGSRYFRKHHRLFNFLKEFYEKFGTLDISLIGTVCKNPSEALDYIADIMDTTSISANFERYQDQLILFHKDCLKIEDIHKLEQRLYKREITLEEFEDEIQSILGRIQWKQI